MTETGATQNWTATYLVEYDVVDLIYDGEIDSVQLTASARGCIRCGKEHGTSLFLVDVTRMRMIGSTSLLLRLPDQIYAREGADPNSRIAVVRSLKEAAQDAVRLYEAACNNRGWYVRVMDSREEALEWLSDRLMRDL